MTLKNFFYDWGIGNVWLFRAINGAFQGPGYDRWMVIGSQLSHYTMFHFYAPVIMLSALACILIAKLDFPTEYRSIRDRWIIALLVLFTSYLLESAWVAPLKDWFQYPRPFIVLPQGSFRLVTIDVDQKEYWRSFPSGHAIFIMLIAASLWPVLEKLARYIGVCIVLWVGWSRVALGVHFPVDVLGGYLLSLLCVVAVRMLISRIYYIAPKAIAKDVKRLIKRQR